MLSRVLVEIAGTLFEDMSIDSLCSCCNSGAKERRACGPASEYGAKEQPLHQDGSQPDAQSICIEKIYRGDTNHLLFYPIVTDIADCDLGKEGGQCAANFLWVYHVPKLSINSHI